MIFCVVAEIVSSIVSSIVLRDRIGSRKPPEIHGNALTCGLTPRGYYI